MRSVAGHESIWKMVSAVAFIQSATYPHMSAFQVTAEQHTLAKYLLELTMVDYEMVHFPPSMVASAALALTLKVLDVGEWVSFDLITSSSPLITHSMCMHTHNTSINKLS